QPITARRAGPLERLGKWCRRHRGRVAVAAVVLLAAAGLGVAALVEAARQQRQRQFDEQAAAAQAAPDRGLDLCKGGDVDAGLLWLARALEKTPRGATEWQQTIRGQVVGWQRLRSGRIVLPGQPLDSFLLSPDARTVLTRKQEIVAELWDATTGERLGEPIRHPHAIWDVGFVPDGNLVRACLPAAERLWEANALAPLACSLRHRAAVGGTALSPDGKLLLTWAADRTARLWDVA